MAGHPRRTTRPRPAVRPRTPAPGRADGGRVSRKRKAGSRRPGPGITTASVTQALAALTPVQQEGVRLAMLSQAGRFSYPVQQDPRWWPEMMRQITLAGGNQ